MCPGGGADARPVGGRGGAWRERLKHRRHEGGDADAEGAGTPRRSRSLSKPVERLAAEAGGSFDQRAVLDQDRELIQQLTQRQQTRERPPVKKPTPPPKVAPYRGTSSTPTSNRAGSLASTTPSTPNGARAGSRASSASDAAPVESPAHGACALEAAEGTVDALSPASPAGPDGHGAGLGAMAMPPRAAAETPQPLASAPEAAAAEAWPAPVAQCAQSPAPQLPLEPVVPRTGHLFTGADIDSLMDRLDPAKALQQQDGGDGVVDAPLRDPAAAEERGQCTQNFEDINRDFLRDHRLPVQEVQSLEPAAPAPAVATANGQPEFEVPLRKALKEQIRAIDSWLEDDFSARERLAGASGGGADMAQAVVTGRGHSSVRASVLDPSVALLAATAGASGEAGQPEAEVFRKLDDAKRKKSASQQASPVLLKDAASQVKPLLPGLPLEKLCRVLRLFCSARHEDHDLYLRILGEIPLQVRGISPEQLTDCVRVMCRLRLREETYLELFSTEAMNMIRAGSRKAVRAPRRPPAPSRKVDAAATAAASDGSGLAPSAPAAPRPAAAPVEVLAPFTATQLIQIGNALSQLGAKLSSRFLDVFQAQLSVAIPRLTLEECELVSPTLAMSPLIPDALRRSFLERCMRVDAGRPLEGLDNSTAAPDIVEFQRSAESRRKRAKHSRNIFVVEACVRKETFSFFSSLPADVRAYLDGVRAGGERLEHEGPSFFASQVAAVLDRLGVACDLRRMAGPVGLHVVAKATSPSAQADEIVYECLDESAYYGARQDDACAPELTACTKLRHRLLQRLKVQVVHVSASEWRQLGEAQRVNYMVKLQSLQ